MQSLPGRALDRQEAMAQLYERYWLTILLMIRQHVRSPEDAEDILLETFVAAFESEVFFNLIEQQQLAWLRRTAYFKSMDLYRRSARQQIAPLVEYEETLVADEERSPEITFLKREEYMRLQTQIAALPALQQEILRLRFAEGLRCSEIAASLKKNEGAIRSMLSRTLNALRKLYEKQQEGKEHA